LQRFLTFTCITRWPFRHDWNYYAWIVWPLKMEAFRAFEYPQTFNQVYSFGTVTNCVCVCVCVNIYIYIYI
jgi:hypothetical protein